MAARGRNPENSGRQRQALCAVSAGYEAVAAAGIAAVIRHLAERRCYRRIYVQQARGIPTATRRNNSLPGMQQAVVYGMAGICEQHIVPSMGRTQQIPGVRACRWRGRRQRQWRSGAKRGDPGYASICYVAAECSGICVHQAARGGRRRGGGARRRGGTRGAARPARHLSTGRHEMAAIAMPSRQKPAPRKQ